MTVRHATLEDGVAMLERERCPGGHPSGNGQPTRPYCSQCGAPCAHCATEARQRADAARLAAQVRSDADERERRAADELETRPALARELGQAWAAEEE